jgi:hypothetical protein
MVSGLDLFQRGREALIAMLAVATGVAGLAGSLRERWLVRPS